jgi:DNA processing protein
VKDSKLYWVGFNLVKGIGSVRMRGLLAYFGDAQAAWHAPADALQNAGLGPKVLKTFLEVRDQVSLDKVWQDIQDQGIAVLTWEDEDYPRRLNEIDNPPPVLYMRGQLHEDDIWAVAVVGTRRMTSYGRQVAEEVAYALASSGITVVSGLARGVDAVAHAAALKAGGRTLAVLGCGVDRIYPPEHRDLAEKITANGAVLSDYAVGTPPEGVNFPPRNRIIAALSKAVVIVEAGVQSGALITAAFAAEQGREVFAVPGNIHAPQSKGTNVLIQQGAHILLDVQDVLEILNLSMLNEHRTARTILPTDATEAKLYEILGQEPLHVDDIRAQSELPIDKVSSTLALMELKGMVRQVGSMNYVAVHERGTPYETGE